VWTYLVGAFVGGIISWFIARHYYTKGTKELIPIKEDLERLMIELTGDTELAKIATKKIIDLYHKKVYDIDSIRKGDPFGWKVCPECGSKNLEGGSYIDYEGDEVYFLIKCKDCGKCEVSQ